MDKEELRIEAEKEEGRLTLKLYGRLNTGTAPQLEAAFKEEADGIGQVVLDAASLAYISSAGIRVLLMIYHAMDKERERVVIRGANEDVKEVLTITGFMDRLTLEP